ncbi:MAG: cupin domain-containing protein [Betaproteobacteria bacterium]|nr:cupin domain-containing protein [Betaproteobacteria bacterium]
MQGARVIRLTQTEVVPFGPTSHYRPIVGDDQGSTPVRTGIQTCEPGYEASTHRHPYMEIIHVLDGALEFWMEAAPDETVVLTRGDTIEIQPLAWHGFRVSGDQTARLLGIHASPLRVVHYKSGLKTDVRGYRTE